MATEDRISAIEQDISQIKTSIASLEGKFDRLLEGLEALRSDNDEQPHHGCDRGTLGRIPSLQGFDRVPVPSESIFGNIRLEFPRFGGSDVRGWLRKCNRFFSVYQITDEQQKMFLATMHLEGEADIWYEGYQSDGLEVSWEEFVDEICARFSPQIQNPTAEFSKLQQGSLSVDLYRKRFEELKCWVLAQHPGLDESYFISSFVGGLCEELQYGVQILAPSSLKEAIQFARLEEAKMEAWIRRSKAVMNASY